MIWIVSLGLAFAVTYSLTPLMRKIALKWKILDYPRTSLKSHRLPVPYLGGVAIYLGFLLGLLPAIFTRKLDDSRIYALLVGGTLIMILGLVDDLKDLSPSVKLIVETGAALVLVFSGIRIEFITQPVLSAVISVLWVVGVTNALNFVDIMDGLSAGIAAIAALTFYFIALPGEQPFVNFASLTLAGATLGFLKYNYRPAKIFMGDAGSLSIGYLLAALAIGESYTRVNNIALLSPILILGIPLYDMILVTTLRALRGKSIFRGSNDHFALRLQGLGLSRDNVVRLIHGLCILLGFIAYLITRVKFQWAVLIYALIVMISLMVGNILARVEVK